MFTTHQGIARRGLKKIGENSRARVPTAFTISKALNVAFFFVECTADFLDPTDFLCYDQLNVR